MLSPLDSLQIENCCVRLALGGNAMSKSFTLEIPEAEAASLELALDDLLNALRRLDEEHDQRWEKINRLKAETQAMMQQIRSQLDVEENL